MTNGLSDSKVALGACLHHAYLRTPHIAAPAQHV